MGSEAVVMTKMPEKSQAEAIAASAISITAAITTACGKIGSCYHARQVYRLVHSGVAERYGRRR